MILVRNVFQMKFGKARDVKALMKEFRTLQGPEDSKNTRILFDLVGPAYTMVMEVQYESLAAWETAMGVVMGSDQWRTWYQNFSNHFESSYREIFTIYE